MSALPSAMPFLSNMGNSTSLPQDGSCVCQGSVTQTPTLAPAPAPPLGSLTHTHTHTHTCVLHVLTHIPVTQEGRHCHRPVHTQGQGHAGRAQRPRHLFPHANVHTARVCPWRGGGGGRTLTDYCTDTTLLSAGATPAHSPLPQSPHRAYPSDFFFMAGTISVSMSTFRSNFRVKHSLLGS